MIEHTTYGTLHTGDRMQSADDSSEWRVAQIIRMDHLEVVVVQEGVEVTGYPAPDDAVVVTERADTSAEAYAFGVLANAFGNVEVLGERWVSS